jgi:hypothetical protein
MAITDRNLSAGTKLYARYKGQTYTAEVVEKEGGTAYRLSDGREFKSPSAAGTAITDKACNGWAFWSVGDGAENTGPVTSTRARPQARSTSTITPALKPQAKRRGRKGQPAEPRPSSGTESADEPPAGDDQGGDEARDDAPTTTEPDDQPVTCATCGETFPGVEAATEHYYATHGKPDGEGEPTA